MTVHKLPPLLTAGDRRAGRLRSSSRLACWNDQLADIGINLVDLCVVHLYAADYRPQHSIDPRSTAMSDKRVLLPSTDDTITMVANPNRVVVR